MTLEEREEREMQKAVAASLDRSFEYVDDDQETGVITAQGTQFGPANRDFYDSETWAITTYKDQDTKEECVHPDPEERKRGDLPAFLRPSKNVNSLAPVLTILHEIPLAREALLFRKNVIADYGYHPHWWNGTRIQTPSPMVEDNYYSTDDPTTSTPHEVLIETQRLMAFLDGTKRSFGSVDALANLLSLRRDAPLRFLLDFLIQWQLAVCPPSEDGRSDSVFESAIHRKHTLDDDPTLVRFPSADLSFEPGTVDTLYDVIDTNLWPDTIEDPAQEAWMKTVAPIFIVRLQPHGTSDKPVGVKIPATWYPDRYMESNKEFTNQLRAYRLQAEAELDELEESIQKHSTVKMPNGRVISTKSLIEKTSLAAGIALNNHPSYRETIDEKDAPHPALSAEETEKLKGDLETILTKIELKLACMTLFSLHRRLLVTYDKH